MFPPQGKQAISTRNLRTRPGPDSGRMTGHPFPVLLPLLRGAAILGEFLAKALSLNHWKISLGGNLSWLSTLIRKCW